MKQNKEYGLETDRRNAWRDFVRNNRKRGLHVDPDADISRLCDEMND